MARWHALWWKPDISAEVAAELNVERLLAMARQQPIAAATHSLVSLLLAVLCWASTPHAVLILFQITFQLVAAWQFWTWWTHRHKPRPLKVANSTITRITLWSCAFGALWSAYATFLMSVTTSNELRLLTMFAIAGMAGGGASMLFAIPAALAAFLIAQMSGPLLLFLTWEAPVGPTIALYTIIYVVALLAAARTNHRTLLDNIRLRLQNIDLAVQADAASRTKSRFLANMSHELRTPLNAIIGFAEMIHSQFKGPVGNAQYIEFARAIHASGRHLVAIINDILDLSKIESGKVEIEREHVKVGDLIEQSMMLARSTLGRPQVSFEISGIDENVVLDVDSRRMTQALVNILSNAVKFTPPDGKICIETEFDAEGRFAISVVDTGMGIAADEIMDVLKPFVQSREAERQRIPGTGLGLPLADQLVGLHGGELVVTSAVKRGTTVKIYLPRACVVSQPALPHREALP